MSHLSHVITLAVGEYKDSAEELSLEQMRRIEADLANILKKDQDLQI